MYDPTVQRSSTFKQIFLDTFSKGLNVTAGGVSVTATPAPAVPSSPVLTSVLQTPSATPAAPKTAMDNSAITNIGKFALVGLAAVAGLVYVAHAHRG